MTSYEKAFSAHINIVSLNIQISDLWNLTKRPNYLQLEEIGFRRKICCQKRDSYVRCLQEMILQHQIIVKRKNV
jgi:hypothetical protein